MIEEQRKFMHARNRVSASLVHPIQDLLAATENLVTFYRKRADQAWKKGYDAALKSKGLEL